ncbi:MAG: hypothetical protein IJ461_05530 [Clostridia bacterium]|nr:hypothetical protein [Clostridia bacterium]
MKKLFALLLCLMMTCSCALAEMPEVNFDEASIAEISGEWLALNDFGLQFYCPENLLMLEVSEEQQAAGTLAVFASEDQSCAMSVTYTAMLDGEGTQITDAATLVSYYQSLGIADATTGILNGIEATTYSHADSDSMGVVLMMESGNALIFSFSPLSNESYASLAQFIATSIMAQE